LFRDDHEFHRKIGIHVSISGSVDLAVDRAVELGCDGTFQIFTSSPRKWSAKPFEEEKASRFKENAAQFGHIPFAHMPYMPNLASPDKKFYSASVDVLVREIERCAQLGIGHLVLHTGSAMGSPVEDGQERLVSACRVALGKTNETKVCLLIENSAGARNSLGSRFEMLKETLDKVGGGERVGVCLDTCHAFASGYEMSTREGVRKTFEDYDSILGIRSLKLIHANDSKAAKGSALDRHEHIGMGKIGREGFTAIMRLDAIAEVPVVLETPRDDRRTDVENVSVLKKIAEKGK
jgi:deoxyribonuclease-4